MGAGNRREDGAVLQSEMSSIVSGAITSAASFLSDMRPVIALLAGVGLAFVIVGALLSRFGRG